MADSIFGQFLGIPADLANRGSALFSENRQPGARGALNALANPTPVNQADDLAQAREQYPDFFAEYDRALQTGDPMAAQQVATKGLARITAERNGALPQWGPALFKNLTSLQRQAYNPLAPDAPRQALGIGMREGGDPARMATAGASIMDAESMAGAREAQTKIAQDMVPYQQKESDARTAAANGQAFAMQNLAKVHAANAATEEMLRDPRVQREQAALLRDQAEAFDAVQKALTSTERYQQILRAGEADIAATRAGAKATLSNATANQRNAMQEKPVRDAQARLYGAQADYTEGVAETMKANAGFLQNLGGGADVGGPVGTRELPPAQDMGAPKGIPAELMRDVLEAGQARADGTVDPAKLTSEQMIRLLGPTASALVEGQPVGSSVIRQRLQSLGITDRMTQDVIMLEAQTRFPKGQ